MSLKEIAKLSGVSVSTASRALSGKAKISDEVRQKVIAAARETGYIDTRIRAARKQNLTSVAVVAPSELLAPSDTNFVSWTIFEGLRESCAARDVQIVPILSGGAKSVAPDISERLAEVKADATIIFFDDDPKSVQAASALSSPVVLVAGQDPSMRVSSVGIGNRYGARLGVDHLARQGHRQIGLLSWRGRYTIRQREDGFREALEDLDHPREAHRIFHLPGFSPAVARPAIEDLITSGAFADLTALFCLADNIALELISALKFHGLRVPQDISVLGFDDVIAGEVLDPPLTTIHVPLRQIGAQALAELEHQQMESETDRLVRRIELACTLVERRSTAVLSRA